MLVDFAIGFDRIDLDFITGSGLVASAYAEVTIGSNGLSAALSAAASAMADGLHSVVFVAGSTDGWLQWNTDGDMHTPEQAVRLAGQNSLAAFDRTDFMVTGPSPPRAADDSASQDNHDVEHQQG